MHFWAGFEPLQQQILHFMYSSEQCRFMNSDRYFGKYRKKSVKNRYIAEISPKKPIKSRNFAEPTIEGKYRVDIRRYFRFFKPWSESPPSITDVPSHASDELSTPIIGVPTDTAPTVDYAGPFDSHALRRSHRVTTLPSHLRDFHCFSVLASL